MVAYDAKKALKQHRRKFFAVLLIPASAIVAALVLIVILRPSNLVPIIALISLVLIQYLGLVAYIWRKLTVSE